MIKHWIKREWELDELLPHMPPVAQGHRIKFTHATVVAMEAYLESGLGMREDLRQVGPRICGVSISGSGSAGRRSVA
jgi:hypothetical protein